MTLLVAAAASRYPLADLETAAGATDLAHLARMLGVSHHWVRVLADAGLSERQADHFAVRLGLHPSWVWPQWWVNVPDPKPDRRRAG